MGFWGWLALIVFAGFVLLAAKGKQEGTTTETTAKRKTSGKKERALEGNHWPETGDCNFAVVGESNYQRALKGLAGDHGNNRCRAFCTATLVLEDDNEHDNKAVRIDVDGATVGYLSREDARRYRRRLGSMGLTGETMTCNARIGGGYVENGKRADYGIWLDLKSFDR